MLAATWHTTCTMRGDVADLHTREDILAYLRFHRACKECIAVFKRCWKDYEKYEATHA